MNSLLLLAYRRLPPAAQTAFVPLQGWYALRRRQTSDVEQRIEQALERDHWSPAQWQLCRGDHAAADLLENWPLLSKGTVRAVPRAFVADDCRPRRLLRVWPDVGHVETTRARELVCTSLLNADMPLIRSRTGQRGVYVDGKTCGCRRALPVLRVTEAS